MFPALRPPLFALSLLPILLLAGASAQAAPDPRISLGFSQDERVEFLAEMRQMLASIQGIMAGIATEDRELIAKSASQSGNRMARAMPKTATAKLPPEFKSLGGPTHLAFEEIVIRAETDDMEDIAAIAAQLMDNCLACHDRYRAD